MSLDSLKDLLVHELKDLYNAEKQLLKALPKMARAAESDELRAAIEEHIQQTQEQVNRLDDAFVTLGAKSRGPRCVAMEGIIEEGTKLLEEEGEPAVLDAAIIAAAQKAEHYEIAGYGSVATFARVLGLEEVHRLLQQTLEEEKETDRKLSELAEAGINALAAE